MIYPCSLTESGTLSDSVSATAYPNHYSVSIAEAGGAVDSESASVTAGSNSYAVSLAEAGAAADSFGGTYQAPVAVAEVGALAETEQGSAAFVGSSTDAGSAVDSLGLQWTISIVEAGLAEMLTDASQFVEEQTEDTPTFSSELSSATTFTDEVSQDDPPFAPV
jgi:hypothetical protein